MTDIWEKNKNIEIIQKTNQLVEIITGVKDWCQDLLKKVVPENLEQEQ